MAVVREEEQEGEKTACQTARQEQGAPGFAVPRL